MAKYSDLDQPKKPRITDKAGPLISSLNKLSERVAYAFAHQHRFSYVDFLNLFVAAGQRECLLMASEAAYSNTNSYNGVHINLANGTTVRVALCGSTFLMPKAPALMGLDACTDDELRKRFLDYVTQRQEFAVGFARARVVIKHFVEHFDPHVATYLLPSLQLLAKDTTVETHFVRAGVGTVPTLPPMWREACKRVAATITGAQLVPEHTTFPTDLEMLVCLNDYQCVDAYAVPFNEGDPHALTLDVKDTH
jgi:hypothetical protein